MKRIIKLIGMVVVLFLFVSCSTEKTVLQQVTSASLKQSKVIENILLESGINYESVNISDNLMIEGMDEGWGMGSI